MRQAMYSTPKPASQNASSLPVRPPLTSATDALTAPGPTSSAEVVELNATIKGQFIPAMYAYEAYELLQSYHRYIYVRLAGIEAFVGTQNELRNEFPIISRMVNVFNASLPAFEEVYRVRQCLTEGKVLLYSGKYRNAVDALATADNFAEELVQKTTQYQEHQEASTEHFITGLKGLKIAGGIAIGVLTAGSGTVAAAAAGTAYTVAQEAAEQATSVYIGLAKEIDWEGIFVDAVINVAISALTLGLSRFFRAAPLKEGLKEVGAFTFAKIPPQTIRQFAVQTMRELFMRQTIKELFIAQGTALLQTVLKSGYDVLRNRTGGKGMGATLKQRLSAMIFDEKGNVAWQRIFFEQLGNALGSATNRAAAPRSATPTQESEPQKEAIVSSPQKELPPDSEGTASELMSSQELMSSTPSQTSSTDSSAPVPQEPISSPGRTEETTPSAVSSLPEETPAVGAPKRPAEESSQAPNKKAEAKAAKKEKARKAQVQEEALKSLAEEDLSYEEGEVSTERERRLDEKVKEEAKADTEPIESLGPDEEPLTVARPQVDEAQQKNLQRQLKEMESTAQQGARGWSHEKRLDYFQKYLRLLKTLHSADLAIPTNRQKALNLIRSKLKGFFAEGLFISEDIKKSGDTQVTFHEGERVTTDQRPRSSKAERTTGYASSTRPDAMSTMDVATPGGQKRSAPVAVDIKSHDLQGATPESGRAIGRDILNQATDRARHSPEGVLQDYWFIDRPNTETRQAILDTVFTPDSPVYSVRFGTEQVINPHMGNDPLGKSSAVQTQVRSQIATDLEAADKANRAANKKKKGSTP